MKGQFVLIEFDPTKEYTPDEYFHIIKNSRQEITDEDLQKIYDNCLELLNKYKINPVDVVAGLKKRFVTYRAFSDYILR